MCSCLSSNLLLSSFAKMGMGMSMGFLGKGLPPTQMLSSLMGTLYKQFVDKNVKSFDDFHCAILDIFNTFNSALPGKHYDVPSRKEVEKCFKEWEKGTDDVKKKEVIMRFMRQKIALSKLDHYTLVTGLVTPPAAMAAKRAGENVPQLKMIKAIPDVIFVPSVTILALISAKLTRKMKLSV